MDPNQRQQDQTGSALKELDGYFSLIVWLCVAITKPAELFLRKPGTVGCKWFRDVQMMVGLGGLFLLLVYGSTHTRPHPDRALGGAMVYYAVVWGMLVWHRVKGSPRGTHSRYTGEPVLGIPDAKKDAYDGPLSLAIALVFCLVLSSPPVLFYGVVTFVAFAVRHAYHEFRERAMTQDMVDQYVEAQWMAEQWRKTRGE